MMNRNVDLLACRNLTLPRAAFWALSLFLLVAPARAQDTVPAAPPVPPVPTVATTIQTQVTPAPATRSGTVTRTYSDPGPKWLEEKIDLDISDASILDAVKKVLETAKAPDSPKVDADFPLPADVHVTLKAKGVAARDALAAISRLGGANAFVGEENKKPMVWLRRRTTSVSTPMVVTYGANGQGWSLDTQKALTDAYRQAERASTLATRNGAYSGAYNAYTLFGGGGHMLPADRRDKKVSLDARRSDIRDALKDILKQADCDYAMEEDVPDDVKKSFTFEDVPVATALDVICESAGIGWRVDGSASSGKGKKPLVRIGKKYAGGASRARGFGSLFPSEDGTETLSGVFAPLPPLPPISEDGNTIITTPVPVVAVP